LFQVLKQDTWLKVIQTENCLFTARYDKTPIIREFSSILRRISIKSNPEFL